jgi:hypothetical protein
VDCTLEAELCRAHVIQAFPSIRVFRKAHDEVIVGAVRTHEAYKGDRTKDALVAFADALAPTAGATHAAEVAAAHGGAAAARGGAAAAKPHVEGVTGVLQGAPKSAGCNLAGACCVLWLGALGLGRCRRAACEASEPAIPSN